MAEWMFWKHWHASFRYLWYLLSGIFLVCLLVYLLSFWLGIDVLISWQSYSNLEAVPSIIQRFSLGLLEIDIPAENYAITRLFGGGPVQTYTWQIALYVTVFAFILGFSLALATLLSRFWYLLSMLVLVFVLLGLRLQDISVLGLEGNTFTFILIGLFLPLTYYFHALNTNVSLLIRSGILAFFSLALISVIIYFSSPGLASWYFVGAQVLLIGLLVTLYFTSSIAHELIWSFLYLTTNRNTAYSTKSLLHFSVISVIYLGNLYLLYLQGKGSIDWNLVYINAFILFPISILVGFVGIKARFEQQQKMLFDDLQSNYLFYLLGAIASLATISYLFASGNDPMIEVMEDIIVFAHIGFGLIFFVYIIANFFDLLMENQKVVRVVYKPRRMPFFTFRLAGFIVVLAFFFVSDMFPYFQASAGYYNARADFFSAADEKVRAEYYYLLSAQQYPAGNHKAYYTLAEIQRGRGEKAKMLEYYELALRKQPSVYAYANLSNAYQENSMVFDAAFTMDKALEQFPDNAKLRNNKAMVLYKAGSTDSAYVYWESLIRSKELVPEALGNSLYLFSKLSLPIRVDSIFSENLADMYRDQALSTNMLALVNQRKAKYPIRWHEMPQSEDSKLTFAWAYNHAFQSGQELDSIYLSALQDWEKDNVAGPYGEKLLFAQALHHYHAGYLGQTMTVLAQLQNTYQRSAGYYAYLQGMLALENSAFFASKYHFAKASDLGFKVDSLYQAMVFAKSGSREKAAELLERMQKGKRGDSLLVQDIYAALISQDPTIVQKYWSWFFEVNTLQLADVLKSGNEALIKQSQYDLMESYLLKNDPNAILQSWENLPNAWKNDDDFIRWKVAAEILAGVFDGKDQMPGSNHLDAALNELGAAYLYKKRAEEEQALLALRKAWLKNPIHPATAILVASLRFGLSNTIPIYEMLLEAKSLHPYNWHIRQAFVLCALENGLDELANQELIEMKTLFAQELILSLENQMQSLVDSRKDWD